MRRLKKAAPLALALMMLTAMTAGGPKALASNGVADFTIYPPMANYMYISGQTFKIYQIFDVDVTLDTSSGEIIYYDYTLNTAFAQFYDEYTVYGPDLKEYMDSWIVNWKSLGEDLMEYMANHSVPPSASVTAGAGADSVTFTNVPYGYYLVAGNAKTENGVEVQSFYSFVTVPAEDDNGKPGDVGLRLKAGAPTIEKNVVNHDHVVGHMGFGDKWTDIDIGGIAAFEITLRVPVMTGYDSYWLIVHDSMSEGLTLDMDFSRIQLGNDYDNYLKRGTNDAFTDFDDENCDYIMVEPYDYTGGEPYPGGTNFAIIFNPDIFVNYAPGTRIFIEYHAVLNDLAVIADVGNPNKAYLEYSNNPYVVGDGEPGQTGDTPEDEARVYTVELDLYKFSGGDPGVADDPSNSPVSGARFELWKGGTYIDGVFTPPELGYGFEYGKKEKFALIDAGDDTSPAIYRIAMEDDSTAVDEVTTPASGKVSILGIDVGQYFLHETFAPLPYNANTDYFSVFIVNEAFEHGVFDPDKVIITYTINGNAPAGLGIAPSDVNIFNGAGVSGLFPETGGIGRAVFVIAGLSLMLGAVFMLTVRKKTRNKA